MCCVTTQRLGNCTVPLSVVKYVPWPRVRPSLKPGRFFPPGLGQKCPSAKAVSRRPNPGYLTICPSMDWPFSCRGVGRKRPLYVFIYLIRTLWSLIFPQILFFIPMRPNFAGSKSGTPGLKSGTPGPKSSTPGSKSGWRRDRKVGSRKNNFWLRF